MYCAHKVQLVLFVGSKQRKTHGPSPDSYETEIDAPKILWTKLQSENEILTERRFFLITKLSLFPNNL